MAFWSGDRVAVASYPRSGNTLLRKIIERLTETETGSDGRLDRPLVASLKAMGLKGEGDLTKWCVKTHFPERVGYQTFTGTRFVLLVRNPFDALASNFQMLLTSSHTGIVPDDVVLGETLRDVWRDWVFEEAMLWKAFHEHWRLLQESGVPHIVVRFEDLLEGSSKRSSVLEALSAFLHAPFDASAVDRDALAERVRREVSGPSEGVYKKKSTSSSTTTSSSDVVFKSRRLFSREQFRFVCASLRSELTRFDYWTTCRADPECPDIVSYVEKPAGDCIQLLTGAEDKKKPTITGFVVNNSFSLRPRLVPDDPYGRGFDLRWGKRLKEWTPPEEERE